MYIIFIFVIHFRGNIPGNQIDKGETLCSYLPPFPANGSGWHRCVFLLYKHQNGPINFSEVYGSLPGNRYIYAERP
jgi:large subunit ribosomal protein L38